MYNAGTKTFEMSSAGILTLAQNSSARAYLGSNQTIANATATKVNLDTENWDIRGEFDSTTNYRFTATVAGKYLVSVNGMLIPTDGKPLILMIYVNGSAVSKVQHRPSGSSAIIVNLTDIVNLSATDYVEFYVQQNSGSNATLTAGTTVTFMSIYKIA